MNKTQKVLALMAQGMTPEQAAKKAKCHVSMAYKVRKDMKRPPRTATEAAAVNPDMSATVADAIEHSSRLSIEYNCLRWLLLDIFARK